MIYIAAGQLIVIAGLLYAFVRREREHGQQVLDVVASAEVERAELLTRIQRPEWIPPRDMPAPPEPTEDEIAAAEGYAQVGTVSYGD